MGVRVVEWSPEYGLLITQMTRYWRVLTKFGYTDHTMRANLSWWVAFVCYLGSCSVAATHVGAALHECAPIAAFGDVPVFLLCAFVLYAHVRIRGFFAGQVFQGLVRYFRQADIEGELVDAVRQSCFRALAALCPAILCAVAVIAWKLQLMQSRPHIYGECSVHDGAWLRTLCVLSVPPCVLVLGFQHCFLEVLSRSYDLFALNLMNDEASLELAVVRYNVLSAMQGDLAALVSRVVSKFVVAVVAYIAILSYEVYLVIEDGTQEDWPVLVATALSAGILVLGLVHYFKLMLAMSTKAEKLPGVIKHLKFGEEMTVSQCTVVSYMLQSRTVFLLGGFEVTRMMVARSIWLLAVAIFAIVSKFVLKV